MPNAVRKEPLEWYFLRTVEESGCATLLWCCKHDGGLKLNRTLRTVLKVEKIHLSQSYDFKEPNKRCYPAHFDETVVKRLLF
jgi:hypothetical protein